MERSRRLAASRAFGRIWRTRLRRRKPPPLLLKMLLSMCRDQPLASRPVEGAVERTAEPVEHVVDFLRRNNERRTDRNRIARQGAGNQAFLFGKADAPPANALQHIECAFGALVGDQFEPGHQSDAARFADKRMIGEGHRARLELRNLGGYL